MNGTAMNHDILKFRVMTPATAEPTVGGRP